ncbi:MAG: hypothetical protein IPN44_05600 [Flavobacteriales bacterium]|nr:hypothetical protein [Flavobacteriales bacterium]
MHHNLFIPLFFCAASIATAQSSQVKTTPTWKVGEKRQVSVTEAIRVTTDSATYNITKNSSFVMEVVSLRKDGFVLAFRTGSTDVQVRESELDRALNGGKLDSRTQFLQQLAEGMYKPLGGVESRFDITLAGDVSGQVDPVGTVEQLRPALAKVVLDMRDAVARSTSQQSEQLAKTRVDYLSDSLYAVLVRSQVHELHRVLRVYGNAFPLTGSQKERVTVKDVRSPIRYQYMDLPAMVEVGLDVVDAKKMTCRTITTYDTDALFAAMTKDKWTTEDKPANLSMVEECVTGFDRTSGWPTASTSDIDFRCGAIKVHITTRTALEIVR